MRNIFNDLEQDVIKLFMEPMNKHKGVNRMNKENPNSEKTGNEKFKNSNMKFRGKPYHQKMGEEKDNLGH